MSLHFVVVLSHTLDSALIARHCPDVIKLDLQSALLRREVVLGIKALLARLPSPQDQKDVWEQITLDVLFAADPQLVAKEYGASSTTANQTNMDIQEASAEKQWERILIYCKTHPTANGKYRTSDIVDALLPNKKNRNAALSTIYTAVKRRSQGAVDDFNFVLLGRGQFRLATVDDRKTNKISGEEASWTDRARQVVASLVRAGKAGMEVEAVAQMAGIKSPKGTSPLLRAIDEVLGAGENDRAVVRKVTTDGKRWILAERYLVAAKATLNGAAYSEARP